MCVSLKEFVIIFFLPILPNEQLWLLWIPSVHLCQSRKDFRATCSPSRASTEASDWIKCNDSIFHSIAIMIVSQGGWGRKEMVANEIIWGTRKMEEVAELWSGDKFNTVYVRVELGSVFYIISGVSRNGVLNVEGKHFSRLWAMIFSACKTTTQIVFL